MQKKEMPQCFWNPLLTDRNIWLGGRRTGRKIDSGGETWPLECFADILALLLLLIRSFIRLMSLDQASLQLTWERWAERRFLSQSSHHPLPPSVLFNPCFFIYLPRACFHPLLSLPHFIHFFILKKSSTRSSLCFCLFFFLLLITSIPQILHTVNTPHDPICLPKCFLAAGWKACSTDSKSGAICYLIGWHGELSVDFSYRGEQGDNGTVSATSGAAGARRR